MESFKRVVSNEKHMERLVNAILKDIRSSIDTYEGVPWISPFLTIMFSRTTEAKKVYAELMQDDAKVITYEQVADKMTKILNDVMFMRFISTDIQQKCHNCISSIVKYKSTDYANLVYKWEEFVEPDLRELLPLFLQSAARTLNYEEDIEDNKNRPNPKKELRNIMLCVLFTVILLLIGLAYMLPITPLTNTKSEV